MKNRLQLFNQCVLLLALPLIVTAAASAHTWVAAGIVVETPAISLVAPTLNSVISTQRHHTLTLDHNGQLYGRVAALNAHTSVAEALANIKVFFVRDGQIAKQVFTESDGSFAVSGLKIGPYSFITSGDVGFAAYGVNIVSGNATASNLMEVVASKPTFSVIQDVLQAHATTENVGINNQTSLNPAVVGSNRVELVNGVMKGRVIPVVGTTKVKNTFVHLVQNDSTISEVQTQVDGSFELHGVKPGVYDFVAAGPSGFASVSFAAIDESDSEFSNGIEVMPHSAPARTLNVCLTCPSDAGVVADQIGYACDSCSSSDPINEYSQPIEFCGDSVGCGAAVGGSCGGCGDFSNFSACGGAGGGGGFGGGGGGGFGGGNFGRLLGIAGLATGIVALADNNDQPAPSTPFGL